MTFSAGLFHRVIGQSGSMLSDWACDRNASAHGRRIAEIAGCPLEPYETLLDCLRNINPQALADAQRVFEVSSLRLMLISGVAIDRSEHSAFRDRSFNHPSILIIMCSK